VRNVGLPLLERLPKTLLWAFVLVALALFWIGVFLAASALAHFV
jgi:hypothetical protein